MQLFLERLEERVEAKEKYLIERMTEQAEEVIEHYRKEFPFQEYRMIAILMSKAYITSVEIRNRHCDAYEDWVFPITYAYAVLDRFDDFEKHYKLECGDDQHMGWDEPEYCCGGY